MKPNRNVASHNICLAEETKCNFKYDALKRVLDSQAFILTALETFMSCQQGADANKENGFEIQH